MDKKEGGESQLDVGGKNSHRLSPMYYTSIAEIKGFRFKSRAGQRRIHNALLGGANHRDSRWPDPARSSTLTAGLARRQKRWNPAQRPKLPEPFSHGPFACPLAFGFHLCRFMPRPCISVRSGGLLRLLQRATFLARRNFSLTGSEAKCLEIN